MDTYLVIFICTCRSRSIPNFLIFQMVDHFGKDFLVGFRGDSFVDISPVYMVLRVVVFDYKAIFWGSPRKFPCVYTQSSQIVLFPLVVSYSLVAKLVGWKIKVNLFCLINYLLNHFFRFQDVLNHRLLVLIIMFEAKL